MAYVKELHHFTSYCGLKMILMDGYAEMETAWQKNVKRGAKDWRNFYICEHKIPVSEIIEVYDKFERKYIDISAGADSITIKR